MRSISLMFISNNLLVVVFFLAVVALFGYHPLLTAEARKSWADVVASPPPLKPQTAASSSLVEDPTPKNKKNKKDELFSTQSKSTTAPTNGGGGGWYKELPADATKHRVRTVYDGDTLTLVGGRRVRFLGIDTPELKERQPYAQEAKDYTRALVCHKNKDVYLTFDKFGDKEDKYERLLAFVWVKVERQKEGQQQQRQSGCNSDDDAYYYVNVNEGIVAAGLATVYLPRKDAKLPNMRRMVALQKEARDARKGIWTNFQDYDVVVTPYGSAFHLRSCKHVARSTRLRQMKASEASDKGLHPCRTCLSDK